jgi:microcystin degradation protein MlrC
MTDVSDFSLEPSLPMRIAIGAIIQESNTFSPVPATLDHFRGVFYLTGEDIPNRLSESSTEISGFYEVLRNTDHEIFPTVAAMAVSGGPLTRGTYQKLRDRLLASLSSAQPGAVLLALHGAMCTEDDADGDSALLAEVRSILGDDPPIFVTHDLHANLTQRRVELCDGLVGYHTAPHVDHRSTGARAARLLLRTIRTGQRPRNFLQKVPMIVPPVKMNTSLLPLRDIIQRAQQLEKNPQIPSVSCFWMQPWLDVPEAGAAVNVVCYGDRSHADSAMNELAMAIWKTRHDLEVRLWSIQQAIQDTFGQDPGLCVFADTGDAPPGGAPGDSNYILSALVEAKFPKTALLTLTDAGGARRMHEAGSGATLTLALGGSIDQTNFRPRQFPGRVGTLSDGRFTYEGPIASGQEAQMGRAAVFEIGPIRVLVHEKTAYSHDPAIFRSVGLEPKQARIVVAKSPTQFRACYEPIAHKIYEVETPGICTVNLRNLTYQKVPHPIYPFDCEDMVEGAFQTSLRRKAR